MGHYSPIVKQMRGGSKPQGMVLVVGTCADGVPAERNRCAGLCQLAKIRLDVRVGIGVDALRSGPGRTIIVVRIRVTRVTCAAMMVITLDGNKDQRTGHKYDTIPSTASICSGLHSPAQLCNPRTSGHSGTYACDHAASGPPMASWPPPSIDWGVMCVQDQRPLEDRPTLVSIHRPSELCAYGVTYAAQNQRPAVHLHGRHQRPAAVLGGVPSRWRRAHDLHVHLRRRGQEAAVL